MRLPSATRSRNAVRASRSVEVAAGGEVEGEGDRVVGLVEVSDVEDEGGGAAGMDEAESWAGADADDRRHGRSP